ncbi:hypothetical protein SASPL_152109 [Salvia splendens]|uniref:Uncharacterized protein n=1 Tax=Salvia splendens TaxID=180675 RepID=A0A8X8W2Z0_SALSN|nr:uncharacterized protein LOC121783926 [Salvia splendens]KAG6386929.1 hypothetical protein SASPL_152109 [Salvia splendens]
MEEAMSSILNSPVDNVKLHVLHDAEKFEDIKRSFSNMDFEQRGHQMRRYITTVKEAVDNRGHCDVGCERVALYFVSKLEDAQFRVVNPTASLVAVKQNLMFVSTAAALHYSKALGKISMHRYFRFGGHLAFFVLLSFLTFFLLANSSNTWKEITAAFMPQLYTVVFNMIELLFKVQVVEDENNMKVSHVVHRGCDLVLRLLDDFNSV